MSSGLCAGIEKCYVLEGDPPKLQTDGMNLAGMPSTGTMLKLDML